MDRSGPVNSSSRLSIHGQNRSCIFRHDEIKAFHPTLSASIIRQDYLTVVSLVRELDKGQNTLCDYFVCQ